MSNEASIAPFKYKKGQSGNPAGRIKGQKTFTTLFKEMMLKIDAGQKEAYDALLVKKIFKMAFEGNEQMIKLVVNYVDGLPKEMVEMTHTVPTPIYGNKSIQGHISDKKGIRAPKEDSSSGGGNVSVEDHLDTRVAD